MTNDVNLLMSRIEEINRITNPRDLSPDDIATIIAYHRRQRQRKASGEKFERPDKPKLDLASILNLPSPKPKTIASQPSPTLRRI